MELGEGWQPRKRGWEVKERAAAIRVWALRTAAEESEAMWRGREVREARVMAATSARVLLAQLVRKAVHRCSPGPMVLAMVIGSRIG